MRPPDGTVARWVHSDWKANLTRTFVPEFLFRFDSLHKFFTGGPDAEISLLGKEHQK